VSQHYFADSISKKIPKSKQFSVNEKLLEAKRSIYEVVPEDYMEGKIR
jgi:hypothetical protein